LGDSPSSSAGIGSDEFCNNATVHRLCPPFFLMRGYPSSAKLVLGRRLGEGAPPYTLP
jgi:hypothetical protein